MDANFLLGKTGHHWVLRKVERETQLGTDLLAWQWDPETMFAPDKPAAAAGLPRSPPSQLRTTRTRMLRIKSVWSIQTFAVHKHLIIFKIKKKKF